MSLHLFRRWAGIGTAFSRAIGIGVLLLVPVTAVGQENGRPAAPISTRATHRFFDVKNVSLTGMETAALLADGFYTQRARQRYPETFRELDPLARPFVMRGWPGQIVGGAIVVSADVGLRYWMHRKNHHRLERLLPLVLTAYGAIGAIHGAREEHRAERDPDGIGAR
jgi:hypothetical protein